MADLHAAIDEMVADEIPGAESLNPNAIHNILRGEPGSDAVIPPSADPIIQSISQNFDQFSSKSWTETIHHEIGKFCAAHYDEGEAGWRSPWPFLSPGCPSKKRGRWSCQARRPTPC